MDTETTAVATIPGFAGALLPKDVTPAYVAPAEENDLADIHNRPRIVKASGKKGKFIDRDTKEERDKLEGIALAKTSSQVLFPARPEKIAQNPALAAWGPEHFKDLKWICRCPDTAKVQPRLNPELTVEQEKRCHAAGIGKSCATCPAGRWNGKNPPACNAQINLLFLDAALQEAVLLQFGNSASVAAIKTFLGAQFKRGGVQLRLYSYTIRLEMESRTVNGNEFYAAKAAVNEKMPEEALPALSELRAQQVAAMEALVEEANDSHDEEAGNGQAEASVETTPAPAANPFDPPPTATPPAASAPASGLDDLGLPMVNEADGIPCPF